jgi:hypothetical protein
MSGGFGHVRQIRKAIPACIAVLVLAGCSSSSATPGGATPTTALTPVFVVITPTPAMATTAPTGAPTAVATAAPTSRAAACTGSADNKAFFADAARDLSFDVYCAVAPSGWSLSSASYILPNGGYLNVEYHNGSAAFTLREGAWCPPDKACIAHGPAVGAASFDGLAGTLCLNTGTYTLEVGTWANQRYLMVASGLTQAQVTSLAAALIRVPKP